MPSSRLYTGFQNSPVLSWPRASPKRQQPIRRRQQISGHRAKGADQHLFFTLFGERNTAGHYTLLVYIQSSTMGVYTLRRLNLHCSVVATLAGKTSCLNDSDFRASRSLPSTTSDGAKRCPGPTVSQAHSTKCLRPLRQPSKPLYPFSLLIVPQRGMRTLFEKGGRVNAEARSRRGKAMPPHCIFSASLHLCAFTLRCVGFSNSLLETAAAAPPATRSPHPCRDSPESPRHGKSGRRR